MSFQAPRGTHDILPGESFKWRHLEDAFARISGLYGYDEISTPVFEDTNLFVRSSGDTSEVVTKQMYTFTDRGDRSVTLKPEGTAPVIRAYLQHRLGQQGQVTRLWYQTQIFRYERPQKGRFRQAHQFGVELIGSNSPLADAEVIELTARFYREVGITDTVVLLNSIGRASTRALFKEKLLGHIQSYLADQTTEEQERILKNPLRLVDSKDPAVTELLKSAPTIQECLEDDSRAHFDAVQQALTDADVAYKIAPEIVRGLDYYTDTVFEMHSSKLGAQGALCGGGRYDGLIKELGGPPMASVGVGIGIERALIVLEESGFDWKPLQTTAFLVAATPIAWPEIIALAKELRENGISCRFDLDGGNLKKQLKEADRVSARYAILIGDNEIAAKSVTLRDLTSGDQSEIQRDQILISLN